MKTILSRKTDDFILVAKLSPDKLKLFIDVERTPDGKALSRAALLAILSEIAKPDDINTGVLDDVVKTLNGGDQKVENRRVSAGTAEETGADGKIVLLKKKLTGEVDLGVAANSVADLTQLHLFDNIADKDIVARIYPPKAGIPGRDALGNAIPAKPGKPYKAALDKTLELRPAPDSEKSYEIVVANTPGYLVEEDGRLGIKTELVVKGDLDYRFGSLDFIGTVDVQGDVMPGFHIQARTGIKVSGSVRGGSLVCPQGEIIVQGHIFGGKGSRIVSGKCLKAAVVQEVHAYILGEVIVGKEARDSHLSCQGPLLIPKGSLIGGECITASGVEAEYIGTEAGAATKIELTSTAETTLEYQKLRMQLADHDKVAALLSLHLGPYAQKTKRIQLLNEPLRTKMQQFLTKLEQVQASALELKGRLEALKSTGKQSSHLRVNFLKMLYTGVHIKAGEAKFETPDALTGPETIEFMPEPGEFTKSPYQPIETIKVEEPKP